MNTKQWDKALVKGSEIGPNMAIASSCSSALTRND